MRNMAFVLTAWALLFSPALKALENPSLGYVNFKECIERSKYGEAERNAFESLKKQMSETLEKTDKELVDLAAKLEDQDYMDSLSPTAEEELKTRFQGLSQEFAHYQNQYYQILNQANMRMVQTLHEYVSTAAERVRENNHLTLILNEDSAFAIAPNYNFTEAVIVEMNKQAENESKQEIANVGS